MYRRLGITDYRFEVVESERELIEALLDKLRFEWDPECLAGFEVHHASWGFLLERAESEYSASLFVVEHFNTSSFGSSVGWDIVSELGRVKRFDTGRFGNKQNDRWGMQQSSVLNFTGRHVLPIWRILKADNKFQQNSFEHIAWHVLHIRCVLQTCCAAPARTDAVEATTERRISRTRRSPSGTPRVTRPRWLESSATGAIASRWTLR